MKNEENIETIIEKVTEAIKNEYNNLKKIDTSYEITPHVIKFLFITEFNKGLKIGVIIPVSECIVCYSEKLDKEIEYLKNSIFESYNKKILEYYFKKELNLRNEE